jgi:hypothetical protein
MMLILKGGRLSIHLPTAQNLQVPLSASLPGQTIIKETMPTLRYLNSQDCERLP